jgi:hypothetical protein
MERTRVAVGRLVGWSVDPASLKQAAKTANRNA